MSRAARVAIGKRILELHAKDEPEYGAESWETGVCTYIFRTYGIGKNRSAETEKMQQWMSQLLMKTSLEEDMVVQSEAQIMMETGILPTIVFGRR